MTDLCVAIAAAALAGGLAIGAYLNYFIETKPLQERFDALVETMTGMKKQGFVPQFDIQQPLPEDPAREITEY